MQRDLITNKAIEFNSRDALIRRLTTEFRSPGPDPAASPNVVNFITYRVNSKRLVILNPGQADRMVYGTRSISRSLRTIIV